MARHTMGKILASLIPLALGGGLLVMSAPDASAQACRNYAQTAVDQNAENGRLNCGFSGPRWQDNFNRHRNWCRTVGRGARQAETDARNQQLAQCRTARAPAGGGGNRCGDYAQTAVDQHAENMRLNCGLTGARWQSNFRRHRNWCRTVNAAATRSETNTRNQQLEQCRVARAPAGGGNRCANYAQNAVDQHAENARLNCGLTGARWQSDFRRHRNWCRRVNAASTRAETDARDAALQQCRVAQQQQRGRCRQYADEAVAQFEKNVALRCGFNNHRWSDNRRAHRNWCRTVNRAQTRSEAQRRDEMLRQCEFASRRAANCAGYADMAMTHVKLNRQLGCGFGGPRWNRSRQAHTLWCQSAPRGVPRSETRARNAMLEECRFARQNMRACPNGQRLTNGRCVPFGFSFPLPGGGVLTIR